MIDLEKARSQLRTDMGYQLPDLLWFKAEILLGLVTTALGVLAMLLWVSISIEVGSVNVLMIGGIFCSCLAAT